MPPFILGTGQFSWRWLGVVIAAIAVAAVIPIALGRRHHAAASAILAGVGLRAGRTGTGS